MEEHRPKKLLDQARDAIHHTSIGPAPTLTYAVRFVSRLLLW
jgi:hypothetical protein